MALRAVYLVDAVRTPIGKYRGALASVRPDDLAAHVLACLLRRQRALAGRVDHVVLGATNQAGEDARNVARMASLLAGIPADVPAVTVNRLCGSGLEAIVDGARRIATGEADVVLSGGVESMTRAPFAFRKSEEPFERTPPKVYDTTIGWRFENERLAERFPLESMGETAENVAEKWSITREEQDAFALASQNKASAAAQSGASADELVSVTVAHRKGTIIIERDESPREDLSMESLAKLSPAYRALGTVTAGNSCPINDGAAALLLASEETVRDAGLEPLGRVVAHATVGVDPRYMGEGPIPATRKALDRAGWSLSSVDLVELQEAFAAQAIACARGLELDPSKTNVHGGAIALGHPLGASGARIVVTLLSAMKARRVRRGLATLCVGVGQGMALLVER